MATIQQHAVVWCEIPVTDLERATAFYNTVLDQEMTIEDMGPNPVAMFKTEDEKTGVAGHLYPGKPSGDGPTVHLQVPDSLEATRSRVFDAGGKVLSDDITIPFGAFFYAQDLDGNSISFFQPNS